MTASSRVLATNGDHLGSDDWDQRVMDWMADKFSRTALTCARTPWPCSI